MPDIISTSLHPTPDDPPPHARVRSIDRRYDDPARTGVRLALTVAIALFSLIGILLLGIIGFRAGFASAVGLPTLTQTMGQAFTRGLAIPISLLEAIYTTGVRTPLLFTGALIMMLPPIAAIVVAKPRAPGMAPPKPEARIAAAIGGGLIVLVDIIIAARAASTSSGILDAPFGKEAAECILWIESMESLAAKDLIALVVAILLAVLIFRLPIDRWARAIVGTIAIATCVIAAAATAASGGTVAGIDEPRSLLLESSESLLLGTTDTQFDAVVGWSAPSSDILDRVVVRPPQKLAIVQPQTLRQFIASRAVK